MNEITVPRSAIRSVDISSAKDCQNYLAEDYPQREQFYTDALSSFSAQCGLRTAARRAEMTHVSERSTTFNPETLHILGSALDDAWHHLEVRVHFNGSGDAIRTILAKHIIAMAEQGERDRQRLIEGALARLKL
jgi:hypothetical protein